MAFVNAVLAFTDFLGRDYLASLREPGALDGLKAAVASLALSQALDFCGFAV